VHRSAVDPLGFPTKEWNAGDDYPSDLQCALLVRNTRTRTGFFHNQSAALEVMVDFELQDMKGIILLGIQGKGLRSNTQLGRQVLSDTSSLRMGTDGSNVFFG